SVRVRASKQWLHRDWDISEAETRALGRWGALGTEVRNPEDMNLDVSYPASIASDHRAVAVINDGQIDRLSSAKRHIFCDGSRIGGSGLTGRIGSGVVELAPSNKDAAVVWFSYTRLPDYATVMQGELRGIEAAADRLTSTRNNPLKQAVIYSDSQAAIRAVVGRGKLESTSVRNARRAVERAAASCDLVVQWTRAHAGISGNEIADTLARLGGKRKDITNVGIP
ncbi:hypothetical protein Pmar_PMAR026321, partial [Perkinsus marinus ATCC 50983]